MMIDITDLIEKYKSATRDLWNQYFKDIVGSLYECEPLDSYEEIDRLLFYSLVLREYIDDTDEYVFRETAIPFFHVIPRYENMNIEAMIKDKTVTDYNAWNEPVLLECDKETLIYFIEIFGWDWYGDDEFHLYRVKIIKFSGNPDYEGCEALIESKDVRVLSTRNENENDDE